MSHFMAMQVMRNADELEARLQSVSSTKRNKVIKLSVGQPSTPPPKLVRDVLASAPTSYTTALGLPALRQAISVHYFDEYQVNVPASSIAITTGASGAFLAIFISCFDAGDRVAVCNPSYPCYKHVLTSVCAEVVEISVDEQTNFQPTIQQLKLEHEKAPLKGLIIASPSNPAGSIISWEELTALSRFCGDNDIRLIVDEIYHGITELALPTAMSLQDEVIVISSFSKYWCMTGLRVGWLATKDEQVLDAVEKILQSLSICAPSISQYAAISALSAECKPELELHVQRYVKNQKVLYDCLQQVGFEPFIPSGAFYLYVSCRNVCESLGLKDSTELCSKLLEEYHVAVTPGLDFDTVQGGFYIRVSCSGSLEDIELAGARITEFVKSGGTGSSRE